MFRFRCLWDSDDVSHRHVVVDLGINYERMSGFEATIFLVGILQYILISLGADFYFLKSASWERNESEVLTNIIADVFEPASARSSVVLAEAFGRNSTKVTELMALIYTTS